MVIIYLPNLLFLRNPLNFSIFFLSLMNSIRIDKYLAQLNLVSRREAKTFFRSGRVMLNDYVEYDHGFQVVDGDRITINEDFVVLVKQSVTILLNKPSGYVSSDIDE